MFAIGTVTSQDGANYRLNVILEGYAGGQMSTVSIDVLTHGPRDALRGEFPPLPTPGTRGLVVFPRSDPRSGIWVGSTAGPLMDAITTRPGFENVAYSARYSGFWHLQDEQGNETTVWPDGTQLTVGTAPTPSRHIVEGQPGAGQQQQQAAFVQAQRVAKAPGPFPVTLQHASGTVLTIKPDGSVSLLVPSLEQLVDVGAIGEILRKLVNDTFLPLFNQHVHGGILPGGSNTDVPAPQMTAEQLTTVLTAG